MVVYCVLGSSNLFFVGESVIDELVEKFGFDLIEFWCINGVKEGIV